MSDDATVKPNHVDSEGGESSPPSAVPASEPRERPPLVDADPVEQAVEALAEVLPAGDRERTRQIIRTLMSWSGPIPPPSELREYGEVAPGALEAILADFERSSEVAAETARHQMSVTNRELALLEKEQQLRIQESESDMAARKSVLGPGTFLTVLILIGAFATLMIAPVQNDWARVWLVALWFVPLAVFGAAVLLRGRYSDNERDVMMKTLPRVADASRRNSERVRGDGKDEPRRIPEKTGE